MELFKSELGKYFIAEREDQRRRAMNWLKITESAHSVYNNVNEFDQGYNDMCEYVKSQLFSNEECALAFDRQSVKLNPFLNKQRLAIRQRFNNVKRKISRLKEKLFPDTSDTRDISGEQAENYNSEDEFISSVNAITPSNDGVHKNLPTSPNKVQNQNNEDIQQNDYVVALKSSTITPFKSSASMLDNGEDIEYDENNDISPVKRLFTAGHQGESYIVEKEYNKEAQTQVISSDEGEESDSSNDDDYQPNNQKVREVAACEPSPNENNDSDSESDSESSDSDNETCGEKKRRKTNVEEANCPLVASLRIDESTDSLSSIVVKTLKFYLNLLSDHDPYVKCGFSSMDNVKVTNQYTRDRICTSTIFVNLKHDEFEANYA